MKAFRKTFIPILFLLSFLFVFLFTPLIYSEITFPKYRGYVNDYVGVIDQDSLAELENLIDKIEKETSAEIAIVVVNSLEGITIEEYAVGLFEDWGIGKKDKDNGIMILTSIEEREVRIEVGYGLEGVITDLEASKILDNVIIPNLKGENFYEAFYQATLAIGEKIYEENGLEFEAAGQIAPIEYTSSSRPYWIFFACCFPIFFIVFLIIFLVNLVRKRCPQCRRFFKLKITQKILKKPTYTSKGEKLIKRKCISCGFEDEKIKSIPKRSRTSFWSGGSGGGSSSGGSSFGGFGGGSSGGGGASGKW